MTERGQRTLEQVLAALLRHKSHQVDARKTALSSKRDTENADVQLEGRALKRDPAGELRELAAIYETRAAIPARSSGRRARRRPRPPRRPHPGRTRTGR